MVDMSQFMLPMQRLWSFWCPWFEHSLQAPMLYYCCTWLDENVLFWGIVKDCFRWMVWLWNSSIDWLNYSFVSYFSESFISDRNIPICFGKWKTPPGFQMIAEWSSGYAYFVILAAALSLNRCVSRFHVIDTIAEQCFHGDLDSWSEMHPLQFPSLALQCGYSDQRQIVLQYGHPTFTASCSLPRSIICWESVVNIRGFIR